MNNDLISRQDAIDALAEDMPQTYTPDGSHPADEGIFMAQEIYADCIQTLKELPSAQPEQRWIPCSERLPEKREMVIIWIDMPKKPFVQRSIHMAFAWLEPDARTGELHWMDRHFTKIDDDKVIAWRELPEPYQAERREDGKTT